MNIITCGLRRSHCKARCCPLPAGHIHDREPASAWGTQAPHLPGHHGPHAGYHPPLQRGARAAGLQHSTCCDASPSYCTALAAAVPSQAESCLAKLPSLLAAVPPLLAAGRLSWLLRCLLKLRTALPSCCAAFSGCCPPFLAAAPHAAATRCSWLRQCWAPQPLAARNLRPYMQRRLPAEFLPCSSYRLGLLKLVAMTELADARWLA